MSHTWISQVKRMDKSYDMSQVTLNSYILLYIYFFYSCIYMSQVPLDWYIFIIFYLYIYMSPIDSYVSHTNGQVMWRVVHHTGTHCNILQHTATRCNILQHTATHCNTLQHEWTSHVTWVKSHCNTLQHTATRCNILQHTTTHSYLSHMGWLRLVGSLKRL